MCKVIFKVNMGQFYSAKDPLLHVVLLLLMSALVYDCLDLFILVQLLYLDAKNVVKNGHEKLL